MNNGLETRYFLSALTGAGYYTLHRQFLRPPERYFCILRVERKPLRRRCVSVRYRKR